MRHFSLERHHQDGVHDDDGTCDDDDDDYYYFFFSPPARSCASSNRGDAATSRCAPESRARGVSGDVKP
jgi:hypothetical protein